MRSHLLALAALGLVLGGCSKEPKAAKVWNCQQLGVPGGETLSCTQQAVTTDGTSASLTSDGYVPPAPTGLEGEGCEGSLDTEACQSGSTDTGGAGSATNTGSGSTDSTSSLGGGGGAGSAYYCVAGTEGCPPVAAKPGINSDATSAVGNIGGGAGSETGGTGTAGGGSNPSVGSDGVSSTGDGSGTGGGDGDGEKADKDDEKADEGGGGGSGPGGSSVTADGTSSTGAKGGGAGSESYRCEKKKNGRVDCTKTEAKCEEGLTPSGGYCSTGGTSSSTSSTGTPSGSTSSTGGDGSVTTQSSTPKTTVSNGKSIGLKEVTTHPDGTKTWTYEVCEVSGQDLSNWVLGTGSCQIVSSQPQQGFEKVSPDPNSGINGVKWNTGGHTGCQLYSVTTVGGTQSMISASAKAGTSVAGGLVAGPTCN